MPEFIEIRDKFAEQAWLNPMRFLKDPESIASHELELEMLDAIPDTDDVTFEEIQEDPGLFCTYLPDKSIIPRLVEHEKAKIVQIVKSGIEPGKRVSECLRDGDYMNQFWIEIERLIPKTETLEYMFH